MFQNRFSYKIASWRPSTKGVMLFATFVDHRKLFKISQFWDAIFFVLKSYAPSLTTSVIDRAYRKYGYSAVGFGYYTNVLRKDNEVLKIFEFSTKRSQSEREALIDSLNRRLELARKYLGKHLTPTEASIEAHPVTGLSCVVIRQPYIKGKLLMETPYASQLNSKQQSALSELLNNALKLYKDKDYLLDITRANLVVLGDNVVVLDTIIMGRVDIIMFPITLKMLNKELNNLNG